jgi:hypothetical protein
MIPVQDNLSSTFMDVDLRDFFRVDVQQRLRDAAASGAPGGKKDD